MKPRLNFPDCRFCDENGLKKVQPEWSLLPAEARTCRCCGAIGCTSCMYGDECTDCFNLLVLERNRRFWQRQTRLMLILNGVDREGRPLTGLLWRMCRAFWHGL